MDDWTFLAQHKRKPEIPVVTRESRRMFAAAKSLQSCPTLCEPIDGSPLGSPVPGILQARTLEWVATLDGITDSIDVSLSELWELVTLQ